LFQIGLKDRRYPDLFGCLLVLWQFHLASFKGESVSNTCLLHLGLSTEQWQRLREVLLDNNVITLNQQNEFVLCRDLAHLTLNDLKSFLQMPSLMPADQSQLQHLPWLASAHKHLGMLDKQQEAGLNMTLEAFFEAKDPNQLLLEG
jgi:membrane protein